VAGIVGTGNSTTEPLAADAVYTGKSDIVKDYASIAVVVESSADSAFEGLELQFSQDGTSWFTARTASVFADEALTLRLGVEAYRFRIVFTNGSAAANTLSIQTIYHAFASSAHPTGRTAALARASDALPVRVVQDFRVDVGASRINGVSTVNKFGSNPSVGTTEEDVWAAGGTYNWLTAASAVRVRAGGDANDDIAGTGARTVFISGLDENWEEASETVALAGTSASAATTTTFIRVFRAYVVEVGTYTGNNAGDILIETTGGTLVADILAGYGQTQLALYSIPANKTGYLERMSLRAEASKAVTFRVWQRTLGDVVSAPFRAKRILRQFGGVSGQVDLRLDSVIRLQERTDIWVSAEAASGTSAASAAFDIILEDY